MLPNVITLEKFHGLEWGRSSWEYFIWKGTNFFLECVIHDLIPFTYTLIFPLSVPLPDFYTHCFQLVCGTTLAWLTLALSPFSSLSPFLSIVKMTIVYISFLKIAKPTIWNLLSLIRVTHWEYSLKPLKHSIVDRILVIKQ